ncbi:MAG: DUF192 domain-containing protein [Haloplanus sp.]
MSRRAIHLVVALLIGLAGCAGAAPGAGTPTAASAPADPSATATAEPTAAVSTPGSDYDTATVVIRDQNGTQLATVDVWVADTWTKRYVGLSRTDALEPGQGMLFVHDEEGNHAYVMRDMDFPLDMLFIAENGTITTIHHAPLPSARTGGDLEHYSGRAKYVLEVPMGYTNETGVEVGDRVRIRDR